MSRYLPAVCTLVTLNLLTACGGGDGTGNNPGARPPASQSPEDVRIGRFVAAPIAGLRYTTPTRNGKTTADGVFLYEEGETIRFFVGDILIGQAAGAATLTPFDLAGAPAPLTLLETHQALRTVGLNKQAGNNLATPIEIATNIALFLQTLDEDGDPANGLAIPPAIEGLATRMSLNFAQPITVFQQDIDFRKLIASGRGAGLWGGAKPIKQPLRALDDLYAGVKLTPSIAAVDQVDQDAANGIAGHRFFYGRDDAGQPISEQIDLRTDRTIDLDIQRRFDAQGNLLSETSDIGHDSTVDSSLSHVYDANGNLRTSTRVSSVIYTYEPSGNLVSIRRGSNDTTVMSYTYDANDALQLKEEDVGDDDSVNLRTTYTYNPNGKLILVETDGKSDGAGRPDGTTDARIRYDYDLSGKKILEEIDSNADDVVNVRIRFIYDSNGDLTALETDGKSDGSIDADGTHVVRIDYRYDSNHHLLAAERTTQGVVDGRVTYRYDDKGQQSQIETDDNGDGLIDDRETFTYADTGALTKVQRVAGNGTVLLRKNYTSSVTNAWGAAGWRMN